MIPACQAYDPAFAYEVATIVKHGIERMYGANPEDVFYYLTLYNENYEMPVRPEVASIENDIMSGLYKWQAATGGKLRASIFFSGSAHGSARRAAAELLEYYDVGVDLWSATSYKLLREEGLETERWNRLHPSATPRKSRVESILGDSTGPIVAVTDFMRSVPLQISPYVGSRKFVALGTDGMGRSDTREALRRHFEIDAAHVVVAVLAELANAGSLDHKFVADAIARYGIDPDTPSALNK